MIEKGRKVRVDFIGRLENGAEFSNSYLVGEPLEFIIGDGSMLAAFEDAVRSLEVGGEMSVRIPCEQAYGPYDETLIERLPSSSFPHADDLPMGKFIVVETPDESLRVKVLGNEGGWLYLDHNHELAGEDLLFDIKLVSVDDDVE